MHSNKLRETRDDDDKLGSLTRRDKFEKNSREIKRKMTTTTSPPPPPMHLEAKESLMDVELENIS